MRSLITGGAGFIGSHLAHRLSQNGTVTILDDLCTGNQANLRGIPHQFIHGSILQPHLLSQALSGVTHVFHLAAMVSVPESVAHPARCQEMNITGTRLVLEAATLAGATRFVLASSCAIYGNDPVMPKHEALPPAPASPYASSKLAGEEICLTSPLPATALRFFNVYGPRQDPNGPYAAAVPKLLQAALAGIALPINGDGLQTRDFVFVEDVAAALEHVALQPSLPGVFNVASGHSVSILQLAQAILSATQSKSSITHLPSRPADVRQSSASIDRLTATGWKPTFTLAAGLRRLLEAY